MSTALGLGIIGEATGDVSVDQKDCGCSAARRGCMPTFVFSVEGQVSFREALYHLVNCRKSECTALRKQVLSGMQVKLRMLFKDHAMLGCVHVQPLVYGVRSIRLRQKNFSAVAQHLSHCPKESCARLRRSVMLTVRDAVSPNAQPREED